MKSTLPERLAARLFQAPGEREEFLSALAAGKSARPVEVRDAREDGRRLPDWVPEFVGERGGRDETAYGLDLSSVWEMQPLGMIDRPVRRLLDLCAAPGGKSVLAARWVKPEFHLANELVPKRLGILRHNLARCGVRAWTQRMDPRELAKIAPESFDLVLVDAPCSGQSLVARGIENQGCFHPATIKGNAMRQRGILASAAACVAPGGWLLYSTCTFAPDENEKNMGWFGKKQADFEAVGVPGMEGWASPRTRVPCHTLYPQAGLGSGGFCCLWRRSGGRLDLPELDHLLSAYPVEGRR